MTAAKDDKSRFNAEANFQTSIDNSIHFVPEARIIELLQAAGFSNITKFYNAFLFGGWIAQYTLSRVLNFLSILLAHTQNNYD